MPNKILEVKNLEVNFRTFSGEVQAVRDVSFDLYQGETLAIVGESGSGKSVTVKAIIKAEKFYLTVKILQQCRKKTCIVFGATELRWFFKIQ